MIGDSVKLQGFNMTVTNLDINKQEDTSTAQSIPYSITISKGKPPIFNFPPTVSNQINYKDTLYLVDDYTNEEKLKFPRFSLKIDTANIVKAFEELQKTVEKQLQDFETKFSNYIKKVEETKKVEEINKEGGTTKKLQIKIDLTVPHKLDAKKRLLTLGIDTKTLQLTEVSQKKVLESENKTVVEKKTLDKKSNTNQIITNDTGN